MAGEAPEAALLYSPSAIGSTPMADEISFEEIVEVEAVPVVNVKEVVPAPRATPQTMRPSPRAPAPAPAHMPPKLPVLSQAPRATVPVARPARPAVPAQPAKKVETLEELLAILEGK